MFSEKFSKKNQKPKKKIVQKFAEGGPVNGWPSDKQRLEDQPDATKDRGRRRNRPAIGTGREKDEE